MTDHGTDHGTFLTCTPHDPHTAITAHQTPSTKHRSRHRSRHSHPIAITPSPPFIGGGSEPPTNNHQENPMNTHETGRRSSRPPIVLADPLHDLTSWNPS